eukprot:TRINITY_DN80869_c0_g1_i1.p1 TRINITY_DN80869_c0_g1~~TRINITY_DN80869_c0_g1_i1.p1  ORF type:complete len:302 (+),score=45.09 TRINITY_DN80869_c0_g1_i1:104-907(+)
MPPGAAQTSNADFATSGRTDRTRNMGGVSSASECEDDAEIAAALQTDLAYEAQEAAQSSTADAALAASLQSEAWQSDSIEQAMQVEAWQECSQRVTERGKAQPETLAKPVAMSPILQALPDDEVLTGEYQLRAKLSGFGLSAKTIIGDGACQFRAVADQLYGDQELHALVRGAAVEQLRSQANRYAGFAVAESFTEYLQRMAQPQTWGDNLSLQALADRYNIQVCLVTTYTTNSFICLMPSGGRPVRQIWLGFYAEYHYTSLIPSWK